MEATEPLEPFVSLGIALAAGLLIGLEREQTHDQEQKGEGAFIGGVRTYPLFALLGALSTLVGRAGVPWLPLLALAGVVALLAISYADEVKHQHDRGLTTEISVLVTFLLGALASTRGLVEPLGRRMIVVASTAVVVTFLLSSKPRLHALASRVSRDDLFATVKFLLVAVLVLPLLPHEPVGPLDAIEPFKVGLMVVLVAGISFAGYVASRLLGTRRGLALTALAGGLVSSTAVTLSFAGRARDQPPLAPVGAAAIVLASTVMFGRILIVTAVVHPPLLRLLAVPVLAVGATGVVAGTILYRRAHGSGDAPAPAGLANPFELGTAIRFGLLFAAALWVAKAAERYAGSAGLYAAAALTGTTDVDAITLSAANFARGGLNARVACTAILVGAASNTVVKAVMAATIGGWPLGKRVVAAFAPMLAVAAIAAAAIWLWR